MLPYAILALALLAVSTAFGAPHGEAKRSGCTQKAQRRAWHTFSDNEKLEYLNAELCLMATPATLGLNGTQTRFDELQAAHQIQADITHGVGAFLPFHRLLMHAHEYLLQTECNYTGTQPYWDEPLDAGNFSTSILLDPVYGFGGDGVGNEGCIVDGPFANYTNHLGPGYNITDHCIDRRINDQASLGSSQENVDACYQLQNFSTAWPCLEGRPHSGGHGGIGGEMLNPISSPGDPIFYLHHTWLDKVWWGWQALDLPARLTDMAGPLVQDPREGFPEVPGADNGTFPSGLGPPPGFPNSTAPPAGLTREGPPTPTYGDPGNVTTLGHILNMYGIIPNATIGDVMDIGGEFLCFEYV